MARPFARHFNRPRVEQPRRIAKICGRPAHEVIAERKAAAAQGERSE